MAPVIIVSIPFVFSTIFRIELQPIYAGKSFEESTEAINAIEEHKMKMADEQLLAL